MTLSGLVLREEAGGHRDAIARLHFAAFRNNAEADLVDALRKAGAVVLSLVAEDDGRVVGHVLYSRVMIETGSETVSALALAPLAVEPGRQGRGIGSRLVRESLRRIKEAGEGIVFVVGDPAYYERFGFSTSLARRFQTPYDGAHILALALKPNTAQGGVARYPAPFARLG